MTGLRSTAKARWSGDWAAVALLVVALVAWSVGVLSLNRGHTGNLMDDGLYFVSAQALRDGRGYTLPSQPGPPIRARYPIGLSALVALALRLAPGSPSLARDFAVGRAVIVAAGWVFFLAAYVWLRRVRAPAWVAFLVVVATAFHPVTIGLSAAVMSDVPFAACAWVLLARWAARRPARSPAGSLVRDFGNGVYAGVGNLVRSTGITLMLGSLVAAAVARGPRRSVVGGILACVLGAALVFVPLTAYSRLHSGARVSGGYGAELAAGWTSADAGLKVMAKNLRGMARELPYIVMPLLGTKAAAAFPKAAWIVRIGVGAVVLLGSLRLMQVSRRRDLPAWTHALATMGLFLVWPWAFGARFVLSLFPFFLFAFYAGPSARLGSMSLPGKLGRRLGVVLLVLAAAGSVGISTRVVWQAHRQGGLWEEPAVYASADAMLDFIRTRLEADAVVVSMTPELVYLYTGRQGVMLLDEDDRILRRVGRRDRLEATMAELPGRPFYLLSAPPGPGPELDSPHVAALVHDPALVVREVYRSPDGRHWLAAVSSRSSHARARVDQ